MTKETFKKLIELMPFANDGEFFLSCRYEPTIHPHFIDLMEMLPEELKSKTILTTNLSKRMSMEDIERLANSNLGYINISLDTTNKQLFEEFRPYLDWFNFADNLLNISAVFKDNPNAPKLRYITMAFKQNIAEIPYIIQYANEYFLSTNHEIRLPFKFSKLYGDKNWWNKSLITQEEWEELVKKLEQLPYPINFFNPDDNAVDFGIPEQPVKNYLTFFINSDGTVLSPCEGLLDLPEQFRYNFNLNNIDNVYEYFNQFRDKGEVNETISNSNT
jgi:MoaA/NifB/PqqE/SkfB family radical SAM enzyme